MKQVRNDMYFFLLIGEMMRYEPHIFHARIF